MKDIITIDFFFYHVNEDGNPIWTTDEEPDRVHMKDQSAIEVVRETLIGQDFHALPGFIEIKWNDQMILDEKDATYDLLCMWDSLLSGLIKDYQEPPWPLLSLTPDSYELIATDQEIELSIIRRNYVDQEDEQIHFKHIPLTIFNEAVFHASQRFIQFIRQFEFDLEESSYSNLLESQELLEKKFS
ncbi:hypothetical protein ACI2JA_11000 [Alkalihalobacillus sp. NPDC078783]